MNKYVALIIVFLLLIATVACGKNNEELVEPEEEFVVQEETEPEPTVEPVVTEILLPFKTPLTGMPSSKLIDARIAMVIIENHSQARPQTGLDKADMVYEILAEGGITRFAAFYQSEYPENVGPVRSIRPYFLRLSEGFEALIVHAGWSPEAQSIIQKEKLPSINGLTWEPKFFWRSKDRKAPHNMYTDFDNIKEAAQKLKLKETAKSPQFMFKGKNEEAKGEAATEIEIKYNSSYRVGYQYDAEKEIYTRTINEKPHEDAITKQALSTTNLFVVLTKHKVLDSEGRLSIDITSGGKGYLFQRGKVQEVTWKNEEGIIQPYLNGTQLSLYPGKTWINIVTDVAPGVTYK